MKILKPKKWFRRNKKAESSDDDSSNTNEEDNKNTNSLLDVFITKTIDMDTTSSREELEIILLSSTTTDELDMDDINDISSVTIPLEVKQCSGTTTNNSEEIETGNITNGEENNGGTDDDTTKTDTTRTTTQNDDISKTASTKTSNVPIPLAVEEDVSIQGANTEVVARPSLFYDNGIKQYNEEEEALYFDVLDDEYLLASQQQSEDAEVAVAITPENLIDSSCIVNSIVGHVVPPQPPLENKSFTATFPKDEIRLEGKYSGPESDLVIEEDAGATKSSKEDTTWVDNSTLTTDSAHDTDKNLIVDGNIKKMNSVESTTNTVKVANDTSTMSTSQSVPKNENQVANSTPKNDDSNPITTEEEQKEPATVVNPTPTCLNVTVDEDANFTNNNESDRSLMNYLSPNTEPATDRYQSVDSVDQEESTYIVEEDAGYESDSIFSCLPESEILMNVTDTSSFDENQENLQSKKNDSISTMHTNHDTTNIPLEATSSFRANHSIDEKYSKDCKNKHAVTAVDALTSIENFSTKDNIIQNQNTIRHNKEMIMKGEDIHSNSTKLVKEEQRQEDQLFESTQVESVRDSVSSYLRKTKSFSKKRQHHKESNLPTTLEKQAPNHKNDQNIYNIPSRSPSPFSRCTSYTNTASQFYVSSNSSNITKMVQSMNDVMLSGHCTVKQTMRSNLCQIAVPPGDMGIKLVRSKKKNSRGGLVVERISSKSIVSDRIHIGDIILSVNKTDVSCLSAKAVMKLLTSNNGAIRTILYQPKNYGHDSIQ